MGRILKLPTVTVIPGEPGLAAVAPVAFRMYACPLPPGLQYNQYSNNGQLRPATAEHFANWSQVRDAPVFYENVPVQYSFVAIESLRKGRDIPDDWQEVRDDARRLIGYNIPAYGVLGYQYLTLAQITSAYGFNFSIPDDWRAVYSASSTTIIGYDKPTYLSRVAPPQIFGPTAHMTFITFDGPTLSNGYPTGSGPFFGTYTVPTLTGQKVVRNQYVKGWKDILVPIDGDPVPDYCVRRGTAQVTALSNFPGRAARAAVPDVVTSDLRAGWNAGASSLETFNTDCFTEFEVEVGGAVAIGFAPATRTDVTQYADVTHGLYFDSGAEPRVCIIEAGLRVSGFFPRTAGDIYKIARTGGGVEFFINAVSVYKSSTYCAGNICVATALYLAGDSIL